MLALVNVTKQYAQEQRPALDQVNLQIDAGQIIGVLGKSGAGKSTLIRCMNRLVEPDSGAVIWKGQNLMSSNKHMLRKQRAEIGMIFQHFHLLPRTSVLTNVMVGGFSAMPLWRSVTGMFTKAERLRAMEALNEVGLEAYQNRRVEELSGGQKQRVAIARVLVQRPVLLLGDEPVSSLDPLTADRIMRLLLKLQQDRGLTMVLNLHDVAIAKTYCTRIIGLTDGRISFDGTPSMLDEAALASIYPAEDDEA